jgi:hypothetical protein
MRYVMSGEFRLYESRWLSQASIYNGGVLLSKLGMQKLMATTF